MSNELLIKFLNNQCSSEELQEIFQWIGTEALADDSLNLAFNDWKNFEEKQSNVPNEKFGLLLNRIHHQININEFVRPDIKQRNTITLLASWMTRAAAILLIPVLTFLLYVLYDPSFISSNRNNSGLDSIEVIASAGARTIVQLSDGTEVNLNYGSKIKYPREFKGDTRELNLSGEGFFNVAHDPKHPFIVKARYLNIKALGTKFNVLAYSGNERVETTLIEGKVVLEQFDKNGKTKSIESMVPGEHVDYNPTTGELSSTQGSVEKYIAWKDGILFFDNAGISDVAEKLGRMYNVDIKVADEIKDYTYTVKFLDESLSQILDLLTRATPVNYKMYPRNKLPDGTYSKQKILFEKRRN
jgi:ferric-dicitrate binding protein FerR (iron transport regulator)